MGEVYGYGMLTASGPVKAGPGLAHTVVLTAGADAASATLYDETTGSGDVIAVVKAAAGATESVLLDVAFGVGLYVVLAGTSPTMTVSYA